MKTPTPGATFTPVDLRKTYEVIVDQLSEAIRDGRLKAGDKLPAEAKLAESFNVSRASVREALSALRLVGLIESRTGSGNYIRSSSAGVAFTDQAQQLLTLLKEDNPLQLLDARLAVEPNVAALAAQYRSHEDVLEAEYLIRDIWSLTQAGTPALERDSELHLLIARISGNSALFDVVNMLHLRMQLPSWYTFKLRNLQHKERLVMYQQQHTAIIEAIKQGDRKAAHDAMSAHIEQIRKDFLNP